MKCPKCGEGSIRVNTQFACMCGNHQFLCDKCCTVFNVPCGQNALPPEAPLTEDKKFPEAYRKLIAGDDSAPSFKEMLAELLQTEPDAFPLLEDFKASSAR